MRSTFKVLFYLKCNAPKKDGLIPVMCRITINGKIAQFSCKLDVEEKSWNVELGKYLSALFHKETGQTLTVFIHKVLIEKAQNLLAYSDYSLGEISTYLNFSSQSYFISIFKRYTGITPGQYRKMHRQISW